MIARPMTNTIPPIPNRYFKARVSSDPIDQLVIVVLLKKGRQAASQLATTARQILASFVPNDGKQGALNNRLIGVIIP